MSAICPICGYQNPVGTKLCLKCSATIGTSTTQMTPPEDFEVSPRWGSTQIEEKLFLHVRGGNSAIEITLEEREVFLGRCHSEQTKIIDMTPYDEGNLGVSRKHAVLSYRNGALKLMDLESTNGTFLNGHKLIPHQGRIVRDGDEIRLGRLTLYVQFGA